MPGPAWPDEYQFRKRYIHLECNRARTNRENLAVRTAVILGEGITRKEYHALDRAVRKVLREKWRPTAMRRAGHGAAATPAPVDATIAAVRRRHRAELSALNNTTTGVREGFVYVVTNPAWPGWCKIGRAIDPMDRTASYQTSSPHRDFKLEGYVYFEDRYAAETELIRLLEETWGVPRKGEWFYTRHQFILIRLNRLREGK